jgi:hypothetical protein
LKNYYLNENESNYENDIYTYNGYFANVNTILEKINNRADINNLKSIEIYAINSVKFDNDFKINKERYKDKSPDLIIISPRVLIPRKINVDLSSANSPDYPDGISKAANADSDGGTGKDGKPGLPGYNGGNLLIISNDSVNTNDLIFISNGGMGGPGQHG